MGKFSDNNGKMKVYDVNNSNVGGRQSQSTSRKGELKGKKSMSGNNRDAFIVSAGRQTDASIMSSGTGSASIVSNDEIYTVYPGTMGSRSIASNNTTYRTPERTGALGDTYQMSIMEDTINGGVDLRAMRNQKTSFNEKYE